MVLLNPREGRGKENGLGIAFILPATGSESTRQITLREGEAGGKHCNVFFNSPHESWFHGPLWFYKLDKDKRKKKRTTETGHTKPLQIHSLPLLQTLSSPAQGTDCTR